MRIVRSILLMVLLTTMPFAGCLEPVEDLEAPGPIESTTYVNMTVSYMTREGGNRTGTMLIQLDPVNAPLATDSFLKHVETGAYIGVTFHRVIDRFMIQGGDIECGRQNSTCRAGLGGYAADFYGLCDGVPSGERCANATEFTLPNEPHGGNRTHSEFTVSMANRGPDTGGSQFFILDEGISASYLDHHDEKDCAYPASCHTIFGEVVNGTEHVDGISQTATDNSDRPTHPVTILALEQVPPPQPTQPTLATE